MLFNKTHYIEAGIPHSLFGRSYAKICQRDLCTLLRHYRIKGLNQGKKIDYVHGIHLLMRDHGLPDTPELYQMFCLRSRLPALQPPVRRLTLRRLLGGELTSSRLERNILQERARTNTTDLNAPRNNARTHSAETGQQQSTTASVDCISCLESVANLEGPRLLVTQSCGHGRDICLECLSQHIDIQFRDNIWDQIRCPSEGCREILNADDVNKYGSPETVNRYNDRLARQLFQNDKSFQQCRHAPCENVQEVSAAVARSLEDSTERMPAASHPSTFSAFAGVNILPRFLHQWFNSRGSPYMVCFECERRTCIDCDTKWHPALTCKENMQTINKERRIEERKSATKVAEISQQCPRCSCPTEKTGGCDHMTCRRCRHQYCWQCRANYARIIRTNATSHNRGCIYHPNNVGATRRFPFAEQVEPEEEEEEEEE